MIMKLESSLKSEILYLFRIWLECYLRQLHNSTLDYERVNRVGPATLNYL